MGKPIRGQGQLPYAYGGFLVNGAKIDGIIYDKVLYINKQRSYNMYDLIDSNGKIFQFVQLVYTNENGYDLDYYDVDESLADTLRERTFYLKVQDPARNIYGFATLYMYNLVKVNTGEYIYRSTQDATLSGVYMDPNRISINMSKSFTINANFIPADYSNQEGKWYISNENVTGQSDSTSMTVTGKELGSCIVSFVPDANTTHTAHTIIDVVEEEIKITSVSTHLRDVEPNRYFNVGEEFEICVVIKPMDIIPTEPFDLDFDDTFFEYLGTDDNLNYKFKVKDFDDSVRWLNYVRINVTSDQYGSFSSTCYVYAAKLKPATYGRITGQYRFRPNMSKQFTFKPDSMNYLDAPYTWSSMNTSVATVNSDGVVTALRNGTATIRVEYKSSAVTYGIKVDDTAPDYVKIEPNTTLTTGIVGESYQMTASFVPDTVPLSGTWQIGTGQVQDAVSITSTGLLTINKDSTYNVNYVEFIPSAGGCTDGGGWPYYTKVMFASEEPIALNNMYFTNIFVPVSETKQTYISFSPTNAVPYGCTFEVEDPTIADVVFRDSEYKRFNDPRVSYLMISGLKRGETKITFTSAGDNPKIVVGTITIF